MGLGLNAIPSVCVADEVQLTNRDPRWVGAWWLGFLVAASLVAVSAVPYFFFPREMPKEVGGGLRVVPVALHTNVLPQGRTWCMGTVGVGQRLDLMVLKVFSSLKDSMILLFVYQCSSMYLYISIFYLYISGVNVHIR